MMFGSTALKLCKRLLTVHWRFGHTSPQRRFSPTQKRILQSLLDGATLKSHRYLDGSKEYRLHPLGGESTRVPEQDVHGLVDFGLLSSNHKFPASSLFLSQRGRRTAFDGNQETGTSPPDEISAAPLKAKAAKRKSS